MNKWIKVTDSLPECGDVVIVYDDISEATTIARMIDLEEDEYQFEMMAMDKIECDSMPSHWMPLPNPPK